MDNIEIIRVKRKHIKAALDKPGDEVIRLAIEDKWGVSPFVNFPRIWLDDASIPRESKNAYHMNLKLWNWIWDWDEAGTVRRFFKRGFNIVIDYDTRIVSKE